VLLLDELAAVGKLDLIARQIAYLRGYGIQVVAAVQTANQLYEIYGQHESVRGNFAYLLVFPSTEHRTAEEISRLLGDQTLYVETKSRSSAESVFASRRTTTLRDQKRPLLTPDEVRRLSNDTPVLLATGAHPILTRMVGYYALRGLRGRTQAPPPVPNRSDPPDVRHWTEHHAVVPEPPPTRREHLNSEGLLRFHRPSGLSPPGDS
jgi:type IV secretion system protein VirD4